MAETSLLALTLQQGTHLGTAFIQRGKEEQGKKDILVPFLPTVKHGRATVLGKDAQLCNPAALPAYMELS